MPERDSGGIIQNVVSGVHMTGVSVQPEGDELNLRDNVRRIALGSDHGGFEKKEKLKAFLKPLGFHVTDVGTDSRESCPCSARP